MKNKRVLHRQARRETEKIEINPSIFYVTEKEKQQKGKSCMPHRDSTNKLSARTNK